MQTDLLWQSEDKMGAGACSMGMRLVCCWVGGPWRSRRDNSGLKAKSLFVSVAATCEYSTCVGWCLNLTHPKKSITGS